MAAAPSVPLVQDFKVMKLLGKGSYGKVYKVQRITDDQFYALKVTDLSNMDHTERMDAVNEIRLLVSINHPNVIGYNEAFLSGSKLCVIMEYAPFGDLRYYISKGLRTKVFFPEEAVWRLFLQLARGLAALHANQVVHRDIKPANIFLCANDLLKIGDLGIAKALTHAQFTKTQIGTPCYMAPEVWSGRPYSFSSDMWSLGCVLYEMMTFRTPMEGRSMPELKMRTCSGRFAAIPSGRYSAELTGFANALLALEPRKRPTADQVLGSAAASKWVHVVPSAQCLRRSADGCAPLLDTIVVPRDLRQLNKVLPPAIYASDLTSDQAQRPIRMSDPGHLPRLVAYGRAPAPPALQLGQNVASSAPSSAGSRPHSGRSAVGGRAPSPSVGRMPSPVLPFGARVPSPRGGRPPLGNMAPQLRGAQQPGGLAQVLRPGSAANVPDRMMAGGAGLMLPPTLPRNSSNQNLPTPPSVLSLMQQPARPARRTSYS